VRAEVRVRVTIVQCRTGVDHLDPRRKKYPVRGRAKGVHDSGGGWMAVLTKLEADERGAENKEELMSTRSQKKVRILGWMFLQE